ncbi:MAG: hypothetical protein IPG42_12215 [Betaproteobacteria bacterium]|nr:hypothetical protein [Betaproteobacteria bacterium]
MKQADFLKLQAIASLNSGYYQAWSRFIQNVVASALLGLGAWLVLKNELNGGAGFMIVASVLGARVLTPLVQAYLAMAEFSKCKECIYPSEFVASRITGACIGDIFATAYGEPASGQCLGRSTW